MDNKCEAAFYMAIGKVMMVGNFSYHDALTDNINRAAVKLNMLALGIRHDDAENFIYSREWDEFNSWRRKKD